ncbi:lantibiotic dehydratase C-terminal domain-containing protein [Streptomyces albicerus]|uniref:lantibiotic dehydratase C-terminal domain-containing protein n=1 Tax=Streptomyces albicerus TaxID=2569859 RepID=UPI00124B7B9A|nr:lantibiotic dehydratase C-terminal domain-containing protein [Streptomyces albicerus]
MTDSTEPVVWLDHRLYHRADPDGLLTGLLAPLFRDSARHCRLQHFFREWQGGPNIRVALLVEKERADQVAGDLRARCLNHLAAAPDGQRAPAASSSDLALREAVTDQLPPQPDNSLLAVEHQDRSAVLGGPAAVELFDRFHHLSTRTALRTLADAPSTVGGGYRARAAVTLMLRIASRFPGELRLGGMSYRSHAEGAVMESPRPDELQHRLQQFSSRWVPILRPLAEQLLSTGGDDAGAEPPGLAAFLDGIEDLVPDARALLAAQELRLPLAGRHGETTWDDDVLRHSEFHRALQRDPRWMVAAAQDPVLRLHRVLVNWGYLHMTRLGVVPAQRLALCHLVADLVERYADARPYLGSSARDLAKGTAGSAALRYARDNRTGARIPQDVDWSRLPAERPDRDRRELVALPTGTGCAADGGPGEPGPTRLASVLRRTAGVSRLRWEAGIPCGGNRFLGPVHRVVSSAGQRYPVELHVLPGDLLPRIPAGRYEPLHHALSVPPTARRARVTEDPSALVVAVTPWRTRFKYGEFAYRLQCLDAGVMVGQALAVAEADCRELQVLYWFSDDALDRRLDLDSHRTRGYAVLTEAFDAFAAPDEHRDAGTVGDPLEDAARAETSRPGVVLPPLLPRLAAGIETWTDLPVPPRRPDGWTARRTSMGFAGPGPLNHAELARLLQRAHASYASDLPGGTPFSQTAFVAAIGAVEGVDAGVYLVTEEGRRLGLLTAGDVRPALQRALTSAVFDIVHSPLALTVLTDYEAALPHYGDRWLRVQGMEAGLAVQRCYLSAAADSLACQAHCGFDPDRLLHVLGLADQHLDPVIQILVGRSRAAGLHHEIAMF